MRVLVLSDNGSLLEPTIRRLGDECIIKSSQLEITDWPPMEHAPWVISFGYRKIIPAARVAIYNGCMINLHIGLLPYNRGAHPNFWSWFDGTPKGVTIHKIDGGIDTGKVLTQVEFHEKDFRFPRNLQSTYNDLMLAVVGLFDRNWLAIRNGALRPTVLHPDKEGTYHCTTQMERIQRLTQFTWQTNCTEIQNLGRFYRGEHQ